MTSSPLNLATRASYCVRPFGPLAGPLLHLALTACVLVLHRYRSGDDEGCAACGARRPRPDD